MSSLLHVAVVGALGCVAAFGGGPVVELLFHFVDRSEGRRFPANAQPGAEVGAERDPIGSNAADISTPSGASVMSSDWSVRGAAAHLRAGLWIGILERLAIYASILAHYELGIAIVMTIKVLRYPAPSVPVPGASERFIIGTFASALFAAASAGLALWLITLW